MFEIIILPRALKDLENIDCENKRRIGRKLKEFLEDPLSHAQKLSNPKIGSYRFRVGDFRLIFDIDGDTIIILRIGHRKHIYR